MESPEIGFGGGGGGGSSCGIASSSAAASAGGTKTTLFHFNTTSSSTTSTAHTLFFGSSPEGMSNGRGPAFTLVQREELERQTMIFKYMMASVPVPPQLLLPLTKNQRNSVSSCSSLSSGAATDSEPWRCRRTDGKKWRCSRDVAPHQKYCERHSHKNRPRSRKPVELTSSINSTTTTRLQHIINSRNNSSSVTAVSSPLPSHQDSSHHHYLTLVNTQQQTDFSHASAPPSPRGEVIAVPNSDQDWHHQHTKDLYHLKQHSHVPPDLCPYPDQARADALNDQCSLLLGLPSSLEGASNNNNDTHDHDKAGPCSLLSLAVFSDHVGQDRGGQVCNEEEEDGSNGKRGGDLKPHWMSSGGPLAEALCLGSTGLDKSGPSHD